MQAEQTRPHSIAAAGGKQRAGHVGWGSPGVRWYNMGCSQASFPAECQGPGLALCLSGEIYSGFLDRFIL